MYQTKEIHQPNNHNQWSENILHRSWLETDHIVGQGNYQPFQPLSSFERLTCKHKVWYGMHQTLG